MSIIQIIYWFFIFKLSLIRRRNFCRENYMSNFYWIPQLVLKMVKCTLHPHLIWKPRSIHLCEYLLPLISYGFLRVFIKLRLSFNNILWRAKKHIKSWVVVFSFISINWESNKDYHIRLVRLQSICLSLQFIIDFTFLLLLTIHSSASVNAHFRFDYLFRLSFSPLLTDIQN